MRTLWCIAALLGLVGCAALEQTPEDVEQKLSSPTSGHLYERNPEQGD